MGVSIKGKVKIGMEDNRKTHRYPMTGWVDIKVKGENMLRSAYVTNISTRDIGLCGTETIDPGKLTELAFNFVG